VSDFKSKCGGNLIKKPNARQKPFRPSCAGFAPVVVGPLSKAREFDVGTSVYTRLMTEPQLRQALGLK